MAAPALIIWLHGHPPTPNFRPGSHFERNRLSQQWKQDAWLAALEQKPYPTLDRALLRATFVYNRAGRRDTDNLIASLKPVIDGLVLAHALTDDSSDVLATISVQTRIVSRVEMTSRTIVELFPDPL